MCKLFERFLTNGGNFSREDKEYSRVLLLNIYIVSLISMLSIFIFLNLNVGYYNLALYEGIVVLMLFGIKYYFNRTSNILVSALASILIITVLFEIVLSIVHDKNYSFYSIVMFIPLAFFLLGRRWGITYSLTLLGFNTWIMLLYHEEWEAVKFDYNSILNIVVITLMLIALIYYYEYVRQAAQEKLGKVNDKLSKISVTDELTSLYNRRYYNETAPKELNTAKRFHKKFCFAMLDVDNFKKYNDIYGHANGDNVLKAIGETFKNSLKRSEDIVVRMGGEEFAFISIIDDANQGKQFVENIRRSIENLNIEHKGNENYNVVTVSIGLVCKEADLIDNINMVYKEADDLLYEAKKNGRNRVVSV